MKGHVPTPRAVVDAMVCKLFGEGPPHSTDVVVDPGCGDGPFIDGVLRYCRAAGIRPPRIVGIELNPELAAIAAKRFEHETRVDIIEDDYLDVALVADYIVGNPPYVAITGLDVDERELYRSRFESAVGRFDLYILFFERSIENLKRGGRLCFITPEKFEYVETAAPLRRLLASRHVLELHHVDEETFEGLTTYPTISTVRNVPARDHTTTVIFREGTRRVVKLPHSGASWNGAIHGETIQQPGPVLADITTRISCGVATGADSVFVFRRTELPKGLENLSRPTVSGRQLGLLRERDPVVCRDMMLIPYDDRGRLLQEADLGVAGRYLSRPDIKRKLENRTCVTETGRVWYRFHDNVPLEDILRRKVLCKDITAEPRFWIDDAGKIVPRHSVYYLVPERELSAEQLYDALSLDSSKEWMRRNVQRAANGFYRLQSRVLRNLPISQELFDRVHKRAPVARTRR